MNFAQLGRARLTNWQSRRRIRTLARQIEANSNITSDSKPVVVFNASARLGGLSQNAAFSWLVSAGLRLAGIPVENFACHSGMSHCVLGTNRQDYHKPPPCQDCISQSRRLYQGAKTYWFAYTPNPELKLALEDLDIDALAQFEFDLIIPRVPTRYLIPLGQLVLPSIRWALRLHTLPNDDPTRYLFCEYIQSAYNVAKEFAAYLDRNQPGTAIIFNGVMYPEATACWVAKKMGLRVVTHEVGFQRFSAFFSDGEATAYTIRIPPEFELSPKQDAQLDAYLEARFKGKFTMAGIRFWPEMRGLDREFLHKANQFDQIVPVFTNVIYDTSQVHANQVFSHMFSWLDTILEIIPRYPRTMFVIRAHPDEMRPGTAKQSRESVREWAKTHDTQSLPNVEFIDSHEYISSYELIQQAKFVMVYNSSIGMEAALMGSAVLCGGKARYTQYPMVFFPDSPVTYKIMAEEFIESESIKIPAEFRQNARRFLYYQLFRASLSFEDYLKDSTRKGYVQFRPFSWQDLTPNKSSTIYQLTKGLSSSAGPDAFLQPDPLD